MGRRGFFAELHHQARVAATARERASLEASRNYQLAMRQREQAEKAAERSRVQLAKAVASERKQLEREAAEAHLAARLAEVDERNSQLEQQYEEIDSLLSSTLGVDDFVDLNSLRVPTSHPPFDSQGLDVPFTKPPPTPLPQEPVLILPAAPTGLSKVFGGRKHEEAVSEARRKHEQAVKDWRKSALEAVQKQKESDDLYAQREAQRTQRLELARDAYLRDCAAREAAAKANDLRVDELIANLGYGTAEAIHEYIGIVLSNSVYPDHFDVEHEFEFDSAVSELKLRVVVPKPDAIPNVKAYKYSKAQDEITSTSLPQKECRDRYASAVHQVALRSLHEVFEADRRGLIRTISLDVGTHGIDPATGHPAFIVLVAVAAERAAFLQLHLGAVVPSATLTRMGAALSKNPFVLTPADRAGVRRA